VTRALIITNPTAARAGGQALAVARRRLESRGLDVTVGTFGATGDGERLARAAVADGIELVIAHGGDGTVTDVATGLVGTERPLGLLPGGTGNVFAGNLGVGRSPAAAVDTILAGTTRAIDVGRLVTAARTRYFLANCAAGFAADLMAKTAQHRKRRFGVAAYVVQALMMGGDLRSAASRVEVDGVVHEGRAATVIVANCGQIVPGLLTLAANIEPDDGVLDVVVLDAESYAAALRLVWRLFLRRSAAGGGISFYRGRCVRLGTEPALSAEADGEMNGTTPMEVDLMPGALRVFVPAARRPVRGIGGH
jgi:diacylglycerol kinase (ATP)